MIYSVIDVETTGGSPKSSKITEIAIYRHDGKQVLDEFVTLVNPEIPIPQFVSNLTGISDKMVANAPKFYEIAKKVVEFTEGTIFVAHNVGFDYGMIRSEFRRLGYDFRLPHLCTVRSSRQIIPGQDSYSLGKLTRSLGIDLIGRHRAGGDALATAKLLALLMEKEGNNLEEFIQHEVNPNFLHPALDLDAIEEIPNRAGIYKFFDENNQLIYLGKSKSIRSQIEQHLKNSSVKKSAQWCREITRIEFELTGTDLIAGILEHQILSHGHPKYNRAVRKKTQNNGLFDDKLRELDFNGDSFYLLGKGRSKQEKSLIYIERGSFSGYGFAPFHMNRLTPMFWKRFIAYSNEDDVIQRMIATHIKKNKLEKIMI
jgi:DNA polymerase-3 subunit epsilon